MNKLKNDVIEWIKEWFDNNGNDETPAVVGISGGKDSSVVAALCVEALGRERVVGVIMPFGRQLDINDSYDVVTHLGIESMQVNIRPMYNEMMDMIENSAGKITNELVKGNTQSRIRMTTLYAISQERSGRVSNNCNASERFVGYSTVYGDDAGDFSPLSDLTSNQVMLLGKELGLPEHLWNKDPIDGLENNIENGKPKSDEKVMGFTYEELNEYMKNGFVKGNEKATKIITEKHNQSHFKRKKPRIPHFTI